MVSVNEQKVGRLNVLKHKRALQFKSVVNTDGFAQRVHHTQKRIVLNVVRTNRGGAVARDLC